MKGQTVVCATVTGEILSHQRLCGQAGAFRVSWAPNIGRQRAHDAVQESRVPLSQGISVDCRSPLVTGSPRKSQSPLAKFDGECLPTSTMPSERGTEWSGHTGE